MDITIIRYRAKKLKNTIIDGKLYINGCEICDTTENFEHSIPTGTYKVNIRKCELQKRNIPILTAKDITKCCCEKCLAIDKCNRDKNLDIINRIDEVIQNGIKTNLPEEQYTKQALIVERTLTKHAEKTPMPQCPQIKTGNCSTMLTDGSILVGRFRQPGLVIRSQEVFNTLYDRIRKNIERGNELTITIKDEYIYNE
jgi:hypothetical protein